MTKVETSLILEAHRRYKGDVLPIKKRPHHDRRSFSTIELRGKKYLLFWFNDQENSTHVVKSEMPA